MTAHASMPSPARTATPSGVLPLPQLGVIAARGPDAASFLHGQLTHDVALMGMSEARLAAFCSAKGRMLASFVVVKRAPDEILLVCSRDLLPATLKRLSMFVLRAQVKLVDASEDLAVHGVAGDAVPLSLSAAPWACLADGPARVVRLYPGADVPRALWVGPAAAAPSGAPLASATWDWLDVSSAVATLTQPVVEAFVPQMLNYESVGGVNFKKGCYPGQEVVARSQFRGTLKRRAYRVHSDVPLAAGEDVFHDSDAGQPCGTVVQSAPHPDGGWDAIVSMQTSAAAAGRLTADGRVLTLLPLPYPLLDDI